MKRMTDRKAFLTAAATAAGAAGIVATQRPAEAVSNARYKVVVITDNSNPDFIQELEWHLGPGGYLIQGYTIASATNTQYVLLSKQLVCCE